MEKVRKLIGGVVNGISKVNEGTLRVAVESFGYNKLYSKSIRRVKNYLVACNRGMQVSIGSKVKIQQIAPVSKRKHWKVVCLEGSFSRVDVISTPE